MYKMHYIDYIYWKERNARIFDRRESSMIALLTKIKQEVGLGALQVPGTC